MRIVCLLLVVAMAATVVVRISAMPNCQQVTTAWCLGGPPSCEKSIIWGTCGEEVENYKTWQCYWGDPCDWYGPVSYCYCGPNPPIYECDCLLEGTTITLADGTTKPIESLRKGDLVLAYDESTTNPGAVRPAEVLVVYTPFLASEYFVINEMIRITGAHAVLSGGKWVTVDHLRIGDVLTGADGSAVPITALRKVDSAVMVYNFHVSAGTYVAHGIIVHNKENCPKYAYDGPPWP